MLCLSRATLNPLATSALSPQPCRTCPPAQRVRASTSLHPTLARIGLDHNDRFRQDWPFAAGGSKCPTSRRLRILDTAT
jgi:hypothetical protein